MSINTNWECHCVKSFLTQHLRRKMQFLFDVYYFCSIYWICYNIASVVCFGFFGHNFCGILALWPGIKSTTPALEDEFLTTLPPVRSQGVIFIPVIQTRKLRKIRRMSEKTVKLSFKPTFYTNSSEVIQELGWYVYLWRTFENLYN